MRKMQTTLVGLIILLSAAAVAHADVQIGKAGKAKLFLGVKTVGTLQALSQKNAYDSTTGEKLESPTAGFQTAWGNLDLRGTFGDNDEIEMYFELYLASRPHPSQTYGHEGYLLIRGVPENLKHLQGLNTIFDHINVKVGHFEVNFGDNPLRRSDNADVQNNALIGNSVVDPENVEVGAEIYSKPSVFNWLVGVSSGTNTEDFSHGRGTAAHGKLWVELPSDLRVAGSYYTVDHSGNPAIFGQGSKDNLFAANRSGGRYGGIFGSDDNPGGVEPLNGQDMRAWQVDVTWKGTPVELYANFGNTRDADTNGSAPGTPEDSWSYYTAEAIYRFTPHAYLAARYSGADAQKLASVSSNGKVDRIQFGLGFWFTDNLLGKIEYVNQKYKDFAVGDVVSSVEAWRDPSFSGVISEVSFSF